MSTVDRVIIFLSLGFTVGGVLTIQTRLIGLDTKVGTQCVRRSA